MKLQPAFDKGSIERLAARTEYELWLIEAVYSIVEQRIFQTFPNTVVYKPGENKPTFFSRFRINIVIGDWRPAFLEAGAPLIFVSTFKLLDMLMEWLLEENGHNPLVSFNKKFEKLKHPLVVPPVLQNYDWLIDRLIELYKNIEPLRGTIIHAKHFTSSCGSINVSSSRHGQIGDVVKIDGDCLRNFAVLIISILNYVKGTWRIDEFREKLLRHTLNEISLLHKLPILEQKRPIHEGVRVYLSGSNPTKFDLTAIHEEIANRSPDLDYSFDIQVLMMEDEKVVGAYFFPWNILTPRKTELEQSINIDNYKISIPENIESDFN